MMRVRLCRMMRARVFVTAEAVGRALALDVARRLTEQPDTVLGLPTGRTPIPLYRELVRLHQAGRVDFSRATTFNLDEFRGLRAVDPRSYRAFMRHHLFDHVNAERESEHYERAIERAGGIDLMILGLGINGHIGFNEPGRSLVARTHCTRLTPGTRRANASLFGNRASAVPREALSMGMATILHAKRVVLLATGASKARSVARMVEGPVTTRLPASFLQMHRNTEIWLDRAAAGNLDIRIRK